MQRSATVPKFRSHKKQETTTPKILPPGWTTGDGKVMNAPFVHPPVGELCAGLTEIENGRRKIGRSEKIVTTATPNYLQTHASYNKAFGSNAGVHPLPLLSVTVPLLSLSLSTPCLPQDTNI